ncbi:MAG: hypothetical protein WC683_07435 [bacterium]
MSVDITPAASILDSLFGDAGLITLIAAILVAWLKNHDKNNEIKDAKEETAEAKAETTAIADAFDPTKTTQITTKVADALTVQSWTMNEDTLTKLEHRAYPYGKEVREQVQAAELARKTLYTIDTPVMGAEINCGGILNWWHKMLQSHFDSMTTALTAAQKDALWRQIQEAEKQDLDEYDITWPDGSWSRIINGKFIAGGGKTAPAGASVGPKGEQVIPTTGDAPKVS